MGRLCLKMRMTLEWSICGNRSEWRSDLEKHCREKHSWMCWVVFTDWWLRDEDWGGWLICGNRSEWRRDLKKHCREKHNVGCFLHLLMSVGWRLRGGYWSVKRGLGERKKDLKERTGYRRRCGGFGKIDDWGPYTIHGKPSRCVLHSKTLEAEGWWREGQCENGEKSSVRMERREGMRISCGKYLRM